ncbi:MAG: hypothetical protein JWM47_444, partial [Acidimicrobiales bacterium]|nr:hypothetical protein [Acidimicrobiales bacterium]
ALAWAALAAPAVLAVDHVQKARRSRHRATI